MHSQNSTLLHDIFTRRLHDDFITITPPLAVVNLIVRNVHFLARGYISSRSIILSPVKWHHFWGVSTHLLPQLSPLARSSRRETDIVLACSLLSAMWCGIVVRICWFCCTWWSVKLVNLLLPFLCSGGCCCEVWIARFIRKKERRKHKFS